MTQPVAGAIVGQTFGPHAARFPWENRGIHRLSVSAPARDASGPDVAEVVWAVRFEL